jgi:spore coat protein A
VAVNNLPGPLDPRTVYLVFQDKIFVSNNIAAIDPSWPVIMPSSRPGDLWYAHVYEPARWALGPGGAPPNPSVIPEFFGDTILVNGTVYPFLEVEQREYRFRLLNACNARFLNPRLVYARGTTFPSNTEPSPNVAGPAFIQIGSEGGFLPAPAMVNGPKQPLLLLGPAERADLIVDFRNVPAGSTLILYADAPAPFPKGDARNDYYPSNPKTPTSIPGFGPNTRTLLQIKVKAPVGPADQPITLPATFTPSDPFLVAQTPGVPTPNPVGLPVRYLTLNETFDPLGRLIQFLGTNQPVNPGAKNLLFGREYMVAPTEVIPQGTTEVWEIANLTGDTHPIHFHLVNVQVLSRQAFSVKQYAGGTPNYQGPVIAPDPNELGWKETVRMNPGEVTRVLIKFDLAVVPFTVPASPRTGGNEYVWHCHILEHEEHDMMRPLIVT